jgi:dimeric dUTPase (all-alpha-NTP-PPase superfamily)
MLHDNVVKSFELQDKLNTLVNPDWIKARYPWYRAAWIEAAELLDHANYKWWKNIDLDGDRDQILLELVDIYHFLVSDMIITKNPPFAVINTFDRCKSLKIRSKEDQLAEVESFARTCLETKSVLPLDFNRVVVAFGFKLEDILRWYIAKNALNIFRQDNGYKTGAYIKQWNGVEDNVVLASYVNNTPELDYDGVYQFLNESYSKVKGTN